GSFLGHNFVWHSWTSINDSDLPPGRSLLRSNGFRERALQNRELYIRKPLSTFLESALQDDGMSFSLKIKRNNLK
ncbi:MAG: hypothetical protein WCS90_02870, partial [Bacilli bacterium]